MDKKGGSVQILIRKSKTLSSETENWETIYVAIFRFDPHATQFISFHQMSDFIASLDAPLGIPKPNLLALVSFDLPIAKGDKIHCLDVLHSLTKYTLGFIDDNSEDFSKVNIQKKSLLVKVLC